MCRSSVDGNLQGNGLTAYNESPRRAAPTVSRCLVAELLTLDDPTTTLSLHPKQTARYADSAENHIVAIRPAIYRSGSPASVAKLQRAADPRRPRTWILRVHRFCRPALGALGKRDRAALEMAQVLTLKMREQPKRRSASHLLLALSGGSGMPALAPLLDRKQTSTRPNLRQQTGTLKGRDDCAVPVRYGMPEDL
jgi:hypothetical protein